MEKPGKISIGIFVVGGLVLFGVGMFLIGDRHQAFAHHIDYYSEFADLAGLTNGAKVRVGGMDAGRVISINVPNSPPSHFRLKWRIDAELSGLVRSDSVVTIGTEGIVGGTYLSVQPGTAQAPQAPALATIPSKEHTELADVVARSTALLNDLQTTLKEIGPKVGVALDTVTATVSNANDVVVNLKNGRGTAGMLLKDEALAGQVRNAVNNVQQATANLDSASRQAEALVSDLNSRQIPKKASETIDNLNDSARQVHQVISDIAKPDKQGMSAAASIRETLTNVNTATSNLAEGTEALKHNFFLRGFFKKRGYYNLAEIPPEKYRRDHAFTSRKNSRAWLSGSDLFQNGPHGEETLSAKGKALLNDTITAYGDSIVESPIVIEGYWDGAIPADQLRLSRSRAMLVRQYLQTQFQLDQKDLGIVPMRNSPPDGTGHAEWDGVCIVLLRRG